MAEKVGILNPGAMGAAVARSIKNSGYEVIWAGNGRSSATHQRAQEAELTDVNQIERLCAEAAVIVSVCPPHAAEEVAAAVIAQGFQGLFIDGNAISPQKAVRIGQKMKLAGVDFVDGGIVGGPPTRPGQTWLHLSGENADQAAAYFAAGPLETALVGDQIGQASALKMCFAAQTKGGIALLALVLGAAEKMGIRSQLEQQWANYEPEKPKSAHESVVRVSYTKAWRFVGEMEEMVETFGAIALPTGFHEAAADIYRRVAHFQTAAQPPTIEEVLTAITEQ